MDFNEEMYNLEAKFREMMESADEETMEEIQEVFTQVSEALNYWNRLPQGEEKRQLAEQISEKIIWLKRQT